MKAHPLAGCLERTKGTSARDVRARFDVSEKGLRHVMNV